MGAASSTDAAAAITTATPAAAVHSSSSTIPADCPCHHAAPAKNQTLSKSNPKLVREAVKFSGAYTPSQAGDDAGGCPVNHGDRGGGDQWVSECPAAVGQAMAEGQSGGTGDVDPLNMVSCHNASASLCSWVQRTNPTLTSFIRYFIN